MSLAMSLVAGAVAVAVLDVAHGSTRWVIGN